MNISVKKLTEQERIEHRRNQLREAQRKRRQELSADGRREVHLFLPPYIIEKMDKISKDIKMERHLLIEKLLDKMDEKEISETIFKQEKKT